MGKESERSGFGEDNTLIMRDAAMGSLSKSYYLMSLLVWVDFGRGSALQLGK